jgi:hypothetical protein
VRPYSQISSLGFLAKMNDRNAIANKNTPKIMKIGEEFWTPIVTIMPAINAPMILTLFGIFTMSSPEVQSLTA